jgi:hypothetical protein
LEQGECIQNWTNCLFSLKLYFGHQFAVFDYKFTRLSNLSMVGNTVTCTLMDTYNFILPRQEGETYKFKSNCLINKIRFLSISNYNW